MSQAGKRRGRWWQRDCPGRRRHTAWGTTRNWLVWSWRGCTDAAEEENPTNIQGIQEWLDMMTMSRKRGRRGNYTVPAWNRAALEHTGWGDRWTGTWPQPEKWHSAAYFLHTKPKSSQLLECFPSSHSCVVIYVSHGERLEWEMTSDLL